jgi:hypothetical protein
MCQDPLETAEDIFFECAFVRLFWGSVGFHFPANAKVQQLHVDGAPSGVPPTTASTFTLLCL